MGMEYKPFYMVITIPTLDFHVSFYAIKAQREQNPICWNVQTLYSITRHNNKVYDPVSNKRYTGLPTLIGLPP